MGDDILTFEELRSVQNSERNSDTLQPLDEDFFERARNYLETKKGGDDHLQNQEYRNAKNILQDILDMRQKKIVKLAFLSVKSNVNVENLLSHEEELFQEVEESIGAYRHDRHEEVFEGRETVDGTAGKKAAEEQVVEDEEEEEKDTEDAGGVEIIEEGEAEEPSEEEEAKEAQEEVEEPAEEPELEDEEVEEPDDGEEEDDSSGSSVDDILQFDKEEEDDAEETEEEEDQEEGEVEDAEEEESGDDRVKVRMQEEVTEFMGTDLNAYGPFEEGEEAEVPEENADVLEQQGKAERV